MLPPLIRITECSNSRIAVEGKVVGSIEAKLNLCTVRDLSAEFLLPAEDILYCSILVWL